MYRHIVAATDFSEIGNRGVIKAAELAVHLGAKLTFVHVMVSESSANAMFAEHEVRAQVARMEADLRGRLPEKARHIEVDFDVRVSDDIAGSILAAIEERGADLLVIGTRGERGLVRWLLGSTTDRVMRRLERDVLVVCV